MCRRPYPPQASPFPNLLKQDFNVALPNQTWASDFTYVSIDEGWLYLCIFIDLFSRRVVGWAVSSIIDRQLAIAAFRNAVANRRPRQRLVIHTDRGCQYTSWDFRREVASIGGLQSMSARAPLATLPVPKRFSGRSRWNASTERISEAGKTPQMRLRNTCCSTTDAVFINLWAISPR